MSESEPLETSEKQTTPKFEHCKTGIDTLDDVLDGGIRCLPGKGLLGVIVGAAGAGKTILALQMCCSFLFHRGQTDPAATKPYSAVYITYENLDSMKAKVEDFAYFRSEPADGSSLSITIQKDKLDSLLKPSGSKPTLHICNVPLDEEQQGRVLQNVFDTISQRIGNLAKSEKDPLGNVLVCVDNIRTIRNEALLAAMSSLADNARQGHRTDARNANFYKELHRNCVKNQLHTFLVMEEDIPEGVDPEQYEISYRPEVFAADIVIRLGIRTYSTEYRERFIQIVKAKHQFYFRGKHHFSIVSARGGGRPTEKRRGVVIYPSIPMQLSLLQKEKQGQNPLPKEEQGQSALPREKQEQSPLPKEEQGQKEPERHLRLGVPLLDEKIGNAIPLGSETEGYIRPCTNSVLVCDLDAMATVIALYFAMNGGPAPVSSPKEGIFISFKHKEEDIRKIAGRFFEEKAVADLAVHYFPPEYISGHKLLRDISELIRTAPQAPLRLVIDNVFELQCKYPLISDTRSFLASLFEMFSKRGVTSLLVDTVEVGEGRNPIESSFAAGLADNVFLLRHVEFHSRPHRVFSVLKLVDVHTPDNLWDLEEVRQPGDRFKLHAGDKFALYRNVLTGRPEPITITFSFYNDEENSPFHIYLQGQIESLRHSFGESLNVNLYGAHEYSRVQNLLATAEKLPRGDCHIVALDEFWLKPLIQSGRLEELSEPVRKQAPEDVIVAKKGEYVCAAHDIALHQLRGSRGHDETRSDKRYYERWYAVPARNNCGILCFDKETIKKRFKESALLAKLEPWMENRDDERVTWNDLVELRKQSGPGNGRSESTPPSFFTFCMDQLESCVSFLLELALSHIDDHQQFLVPQQNYFRLGLDMSQFPPDALTTLVDLLDQEELQRLASGVFRSSADEPPAVFTRQWMSTLGCLKARTRTTKGLVYGAARTFSEPDCDGYFQRLEPHELPEGWCGHPTPVSGTWYLGILKGSIAVETGVRLIGQFTSPGDELYKLNNYIGFPVRRGFYEGEDSYNLPYHARFMQLAEVQGQFISSPDECRPIYTREILEAMNPLYRMLIQDYNRVAPILWRLMVKTARDALDLGTARTPTDLGKRIKRRIEEASNEYKAVKGGDERPGP